jgi:hypothetical protein
VQVVACAVMCGLCTILDFFVLPHEGVRKCTLVHMRRWNVQLCAVNVQLADLNAKGAERHEGQYPLKITVRPLGAA